MAKLAYSPGISAINLTTRSTCAQDGCTVLIGIERLPSTSSAKCSADSNGNIGNSNVGSGNYGNSNTGDNNIGVVVLRSM